MLVISYILGTITEREARTLNNGTKIRMALRITVSLNTAMYVVIAAVDQLGYHWLILAWAIITFGVSL